MPKRRLFFLLVGWEKRLQFPIGSDSPNAPPRIGLFDRQSADTASASNRHPIFRRSFDFIHSFVGHAWPVVHSSRGRVGARARTRARGKRRTYFLDAPKQQHSWWEGCASSVRAHARPTSNPNHMFSFTRRCVSEESSKEFSLPSSITTRGARQQTLTDGRRQVPLIYSFCNFL